jgi:hypothetical protein
MGNQIEEDQLGYIGEKRGNPKESISELGST